MYSYISMDKPNRERQTELDLVKFVAIFMMIACHTGLYYLEEGTLGYTISDYIGGQFAAPVFMVCMGIGTVFSHHNKPNDLINRGIRLVIYGYVLNLIRATIPEILITFVGLSYFGIGASFYMVDILQFAGLSMVLLGLFKKWKIEPAYQILIALLMTGLGEYLFWVSSGNEWIDAIADLIWGANTWSFFPLLTWFIFPAVGVYFGEILMHCNDKNELYKRLLPIGLVGVVLAYYGMLKDGSATYYGGSYYFMGIRDVIYALFFPMLSFSLAYYIDQKTNLGKNRFVSYSSKNINSLYCISWFYIFWGMYYFGLYKNCWPRGIVFILVLVLIFVLTYVTCEIWNRIKAKRKHSA